MDHLELVSISMWRGHLECMKTQERFYVFHKWWRGLWFWKRWYYKKNKDAFLKAYINLMEKHGCLPKLHH